MELKKYQQKALAILHEYLLEARHLGAKAAYKKVTDPIEMKLRLGELSGYEELSKLPNTPRVCLKVPTGGGKTILGAYSLRIISDSWCACENPIVLWFCPSDTIRKQTAEALKNPRHPYRKVLDEQFDGRVRVFDIDEKFDIRPADLEQNLCVIVSTMQSFRQNNIDQYNVYKHNENLEPHFSGLRIEPGMDVHENGAPKYSFVNLLRHYRPVILVDEAHRAVTELSEEMHARLNPSIILELTATPYTKNNTLYNVSAIELKNEEMIKIPIALSACNDWERAITLAVQQQKYLEVQAQADKEYLRPIALIQAQSKSQGDETRLVPEVIREHLMRVHNIPESHIAIATGEQKELDKIDLFRPDCPIRFVITIEALKEGWDCSFAYILCSLSNIKSNTAIQQLLGRVMRMPYAKKRNIPKLNKSYAFVLSSSFAEAAGEIVERLKESGFDEKIATDCLEQVAHEDLLRELGIYGSGIKLSSEEAGVIEASENVRVLDDGQGGHEIYLTVQATEKEVVKFAEQLPPEKREQVKAIAVSLRSDTISSASAGRQVAKTPAEKGEKMRVPRLMTEIDGELVPAELDYMVEAFPWDINDYAKADIGASGLMPDSSGISGEIVLEGDSMKNQRLGYVQTQENQLELDLESVQPDGWDEAVLVNWLDKKVRQGDIRQEHMLRWLSTIVHALTVVHGKSISQLMTSKYYLVNRLRHEIDVARKTMKKAAYQMSLFSDSARVELDFQNGFEFKLGMYEDELSYNGPFIFQKHFLPKVPAFDGKESGEEFECAKMIDSLPQVRYWVRNKSRHPNSFRLPTSSDYFYPDFVARLCDDRLLVVEYKSKDRMSTEDTAEKGAIGRLWEERSLGKGLFMLASGSKEDPSVFRQMFTDKIS